MFGGWNLLNVIVLPVCLVSLAALFWQTRRRPQPA
jgi:hypothetical protein